MNEVIKTVYKCNSNLFSAANYDATQDIFVANAPDLTTGSQVILRRDYGLLELMNPNTSTLDDKSKVLFTSGCKFSRSRFREWAKEKEISIVRIPSKADVIIVDKSSLPFIARVNTLDSSSHITAYLYVIKKNTKVHMRYFGSTTSYRYLDLPVGFEIYFEERLIDPDPEYLSLVGVHNLVKTYHVTKAKDNYIKELIRLAPDVHTKKIIDVSNVEKSIVKNQDVDLVTFQYIVSLLDSNDPEINRVGMLQLNQLDLEAWKFSVDVIIRMFWYKLVRWGAPESTERTKLRRELLSSVLFTSIRDFVDKYRHRVVATYGDIQDGDSSMEKNLKIFCNICKSIVTSYRNDKKKVPLDEERILVAQYYNLCKEVLTKGIADNMSPHGIPIYDYIRFNSISCNLRDLTDLGTIYPELEIPTK
jgi:hypothetical protein